MRFLYSRLNNYYVPNLIYLFILRFRPSTEIYIFFILQEIHGFSITPTRPWLTTSKLHLNADQNPPPVHFQNLLSFPYPSLSHLITYANSTIKGGWGVYPPGYPEAWRLCKGKKKKKERNALPRTTFLIKNKMWANANEQQWWIILSCLNFFRSSSQSVLFLWKHCLPTACSTILTLR